MNELESPQTTNQPLVPRAPREPLVWPFLRAAGISLAVGGTCLWLASANFGRLSGASRSSRLKWEQRQSQVDAVIRAEEAMVAQTEAK